MLSADQNERLTRIGLGTPMGDLIRRYWIPALPAERLAEPDDEPVRVKLLGERLVAFRDTSGRIGLLDERCPHRTASLFLGRNEENGLRCIYHGWKFDVRGQCVDLPTEPQSPRAAAAMRVKSYPCIERGGLIWAYMGPAELIPDFPELEWTRVPDSHRHFTRRIQECNWLQAVEGGYDATHFTFLHRGDLSTDYPLPMQSEFARTDGGFVYAYGRELKDGRRMWSSDTFLMPFHKLIATPVLGAAIWVPVDDATTMLYNIDYDPNQPISDAQLSVYRDGVLNHADSEHESERMVQNRDNNYRIDRAAQRDGRSFSGIRGVGVQDSAVQESMGEIVDRSIEHLSATDAPIVQLRRYLIDALDALAAGNEIPAARAGAYNLRPLWSFTGKDVSFDEAVSDYFATAKAVR